MLGYQHLDIDMADARCHTSLSCMCGVMNRCCLVSKYLSGTYGYSNFQFDCHLDLVFCLLLGCETLNLWACHAYIYNLSPKLQHLMIQHLNYTTHFPSTKHSSVNLPHIITTMVVIRQILGPICHLIEVINAYMWRGPHWGCALGSRSTWRIHQWLN